MEKATGRGAVVVSIHDVSPLTRERTEAILGDLRGAGCGRVSLLVVPDHHGRGRISQDGEFGEWLRAKVAEGHEAVLHGYRHLRERSEGDGWGRRLVTEHYTAGEGEFFDLERSEARRRLDMGISELSACGVAAAGFIAPAWLLGAEAEQAVREAGFEYTTRIGTVVDFKGGATHRARSLVWSVRAGWRRVCSLVWNRALFAKLSGAPLVRIGIHPPDWDHGAVRRQVLGITGAALAGRTAMTYQQWLVFQRNGT
jgi:predicted deacetylase